MEEEIDLSKLFATLWHGKHWIALSSLIFLAAGSWYAFVVPVPTYSAHAKVALESREQNVMDIESVVTGLGADQPTINTEVEVIKSRVLAERLVNDLDLTNDPEFNAMLRKPPVFSVGMVVGFLREWISGPLPSKPDPANQVIFDATVDSLLSAISVSNARNTFVFKIGAITEDPVKSATIANRLSELYLEDQVQVKFEKTEQATIWLTDRVAELKLSLEEAEDALKTFNSSADIVSAENLLGLNLQLREFRERRERLEAQNSERAQSIDRLSVALQEGDFERFATLANERSFTSFLQRVSGSEAERKQLLSAQARIVLDKKNLDREISRNQLVAVISSMEEVSARIDKQSDDLVRLQQLQREAEANRLIYEAFLSRLKETSIQQGIQQADARILSRAVVRRAPIAPRKSRIMALSLTLGMIIGAGLVLLRGFSQNTFRTAEDLEALTQTTVLAQVPLIPARKRSKVVQYLIDKPSSGAAQAIRNLRTSLLLGNVDKELQVIMSTSSIPGEGKSTLSIALALHFSQMGEKVLLFEGDIRRRVFENYFDNTSRKSFLSVLSGESSLEEAINKAGDQNFDVLMGESGSVDATDLFSSEKFEVMLTDLRKLYDRIIIDSPPVLPVPDARVLGQQVDATVYMVQWDRTARRDVLSGLKSLKSANVTVSGVVLGRVNSRGMKRYGYGNSYGSYKGYYAD